MVKKIDKPILVCSRYPSLLGLDAEHRAFHPGLVSARVDRGAIPIDPNSVRQNGNTVRFSGRFHMIILKILTADVDKPFRTSRLFPSLDVL